VLKRRPGETTGRFEIPILLPIMGIAVCGVLLVTRLSSSEWKAPALAGALLVGILALYAVLRLTKASQR